MYGASSKKNTFKTFRFIYICVHFAQMHVYVPHVYLVFLEVRKNHQSPWKYN